MKQVLVLISLIIALLASGCNPVRQVLNDPVKFRKVADEVVARGYCVNDTVTTVLLKDTTIIKEVHIRDSIAVRLAGKELCDIDTTSKGGIRLQIRNGRITRLSYQGKEKERVKTVMHKFYIRDTKYEALLKTQLNQSFAQVESVQKDLTEKTQQLNATTKQLRWRTFQFYALISLLLLILIGKLHARIRRFLPFLP